MGKEKKVGTGVPGRAGFRTLFTGVVYVCPCFSSVSIPLTFSRLVCHFSKLFRACAMDFILNRDLQSACSSEMSCPNRRYPSRPGRVGRREQRDRGVRETTRSNNQCSISNANRRIHRDPRHTYSLASLTTDIFLFSSRGPLFPRRRSCSSLLGLCFGFAIHCAFLTLHTTISSCLHFPFGCSPQCRRRTGKSLLIGLGTSLNPANTSNGRFCRLESA